MSAKQVILSPLSPLLLLFFSHFLRFICFKPLSFYATNLKTHLRISEVIKHHFLRKQHGLNEPGYAIFLLKWLGFHTKMSAGINNKLFPYRQVFLWGTFPAGCDLYPSNQSRLKAGTQWCPFSSDKPGILLFLAATQMCSEIFSIGVYFLLCGGDCWQALDLVKNKIKYRSAPI